MENAENNNNKLVPREQGSKSVQTDLSKVEDSKKDDIFVPHSAQEKLRKEREYYDSPDNPAQKFNLNDQAYSQSSAKNFITTVSAFHHADQADDKGQYSADE